MRKFLLFMLLCFTIQAQVHVNGVIHQDTILKQKLEYTKKKLEHANNFTRRAYEVKISKINTQLKKESSVQHSKNMSNLYSGLKIGAGFVVPIHKTPIFGLSMEFLNLNRFRSSLPKYGFGIYYDFAIYGHSPPDYIGDGDWSYSWWMDVSPENTISKEDIKQETCALSYSIGSVFDLNKHLHFYTGLSYSKITTWHKYSWETTGYNGRYIDSGTGETIDDETKKFGFDLGILLSSDMSKKGFWYGGYLGYNTSLQKPKIGIKAGFSL